VFIEKQNKKAYEVDFTVLSAANLKSKQDKEISQVSTILGNINSTPLNWFFFFYNILMFLL
jgi:hypothetical protein